MMLGRLPSINDSRTLKLATYLAPDLKPVPDKVDWVTANQGRFNLGHNDVYGDCVTVTAANMINSANANEDETKPALIDDHAIVEQAKVYNGLWGMTILDRLKYWRKNPMFGSQIEVFAKADADNIDLLKFIIFTFGSADIGVWMPNAWKSSMQFWDIGGGPLYRPGSWGGHSVPFIGYEPSVKYGTIFHAVSWAKVVEVTEAAVRAYVDEVWASILPDWFEWDGISPSGLNIDALRADMAYVTMI